MSHQHQQQFQFPLQAQQTHPATAAPVQSNAAPSSSSWISDHYSLSHTESAEPSFSGNNTDMFRSSSPLLSFQYSSSPFPSGPVGSATDPPAAGLLAPIVITAAPAVSLVAPRPVRARRHQKSIIAVEAFVPQLQPSPASTNNDPTMIVQGGPFFEPQQYQQPQPQPQPSQPQIQMQTAGSNSSRLNEQHNVVCSELAQLTINSSQRGKIERVGPGNAVTRTHVRAPSAEFADEIPFPSFSSTSTEYADGSSGTSSSSNSINNNNNNTNNITSTIAAPITPISTGLNTGRRRATTHSRSRSRKASLLEHWDIQNIRLSGQDLVGSTDVSLFLPADLGPPPQTPERRIGFHHRTGSGVGAGAGVVGAGPSEGLHVQTSDLAQLQPMQLYSPTSEAVAELFQIMRHTSLAGNNGVGSSSSLLAPAAAPASFSSSSGAWGCWPGTGNGYEGYGEPGFRHLRTPSSSSSSSSLSSNFVGYNSFAMTSNTNSSNVSGYGNSFWSMSSAQSGFVPPSPVSRTSRNPIVENDAFQAGLGGAPSAPTAVGGGIGGFSFPS
ncbi:uncharacterized protein SAPINGB_P002154 [Magnusiomyces paraingens]|uniref:Uncharacterized protein n=1 Tax=Magnusiomyces paraingens TaxID=2606893 RepID=A0A5E8BD18_9ASCO|nr:uncharacterized protein SAPINGB_P002154 [Saprochaete ingens]VVT49203.1 unnamed protein product [Saprochaete ingens]